MLPEAVALLETESWIALDDDDVLHLLARPAIQPAPNTRPYLARGVVLGSKPDVTLIFVNRETNDLFIFHGLVTTELGLPVYDDPHPVGLVVYLKSPPNEVLVDGLVGGDGMMGRALEKDADLR